MHDVNPRTQDVNAKERPRAAPGLLAAAAAQAPARVVKKLDAQPRLADAWTWDGLSVRTDGEAVVTLAPADGVVTSLGQVRCSCLLAPRCLHVLAVVSALPVAEAGDEAGAPAAPVAPATQPAPASTAPLTPAQADAVRLLAGAAAEIVAGGAAAAGTVLQADVLRAVHECRVEGLHRLAAAGTRVVRGIRELRGEVPEFSLPRFADDLAELLAVAAGLGTGGPVEPDLVGTARAAYASVGGLSLWGVFTEAVVAASGYAGVVTWLCDAGRRLWTLSEVAPGEATRAAAAYDAGARVGDVTLSHRALSRAGLFLQDATASEQGRLGAGAGVKAVAAPGRGWEDEPLAGLWRQPLREQVERALREGGAAGSDLLFVEGRIMGADGDALLIAAAAGAPDGVELPVRCVPALQHAALHHAEDLRLLARAIGLGVRAVGRVLPRRAGTMVLLAVGPAPAHTGKETADEAGGTALALALPAAWAGRCNLGLDRLQGAQFKGAVASTAPRAPAGRGSAEEIPDPLEPLRRRLQRAALGGRATLPPAALPELERESGQLARRGLPTAAGLLRRMGAAAQEADRDASGARRPASAEDFARAWLALATFEREAARAIEQALWLGENSTPSEVR